MSKIDLHIHSNFSGDGEFDPEEIVAKCRSQGMELIAITDHNSVRGAAGILSAAKGLRVLSGVELDCSYRGRNFHVLGYGFDVADRKFEEIEEDIINQEREAAEVKIRLFQKATGIPVNVREVLDAAGNGVVTGELIAELLLAKENARQYGVLLPYLEGGEKSDMPNVRFYWDFFSEGRPAYVPIRYLSLPDVVALIHRGGGIAVLAHPGQNLDGDDALLHGIISEKIDGIEVFSSYHDRTLSEHYLEIAEKSRLLVTAGSDFHGKHKPNIRLGGHGAVWNDQKLIADIESRLSARQD